MKRPRNQLRPSFESLDVRIVCSSTVLGSTTSSVNNFPPNPPVIPGSFPSANRFRAFTPADLQDYSKAYLSFSTDKKYNPAYDFNGTGFIGQNDATPILRGLASITPRVPFKLNLALAPGQQIFTHHPSINGAATRLGMVTIEGRTTPNSIVFYDALVNNRFGFAGNLKYQGGAVLSDAQGRFQLTTPLTPLSKNSLTTQAFLIRTPFDQQITRIFPIFRVGGPVHPSNTVAS